MHSTQQQIEELASQIMSTVETAEGNGDTTELAALVDEYSAEAVAAFVWNMHSKIDDVDDWADNFRDSYVGEVEIEDYVDELLDEGVFGDIPTNLRSYIDYERLGRDLLIDSYWTVAGHLFRND
jgi:antirestriction protein